MVVSIRKSTRRRGEIVLYSQRRHLNGSSKLHLLAASCVTDRRLFQRIFLIDLLNFSFWSPDPSTEFAVEYDGAVYTDYFALCAVVKRAHKASPKLRDFF